MTTNKKKVSPKESTPATPEPPLVIDLPDGQKLVIGQMASGSVIEVATWRGTGRPDSSTSRLMLGMAPGSLTPTVVVPENGETNVHPAKKDLAFFINLIRTLPKNLLIKSDSSAAKDDGEKVKSEKALSLKSDEPKTRRAHFLDFLVRSSHEQAVEVADTQEQAEIDKWLEEIRSRSSVSKPVTTASKTSARKSTKTRKANPASTKSRNK